jgi:simple sugar transport system permease protein
MTATASEADRVRRLSPWRRFLNRPEFGAVIGTVVIFVFFAVLAGDKGFLSARGVAGYLQIAAEVGILGTTVAMLMIAGEFDLSIGSMIGASGIVLALSVMEFGLPIWVGVILAFAFALAVGAYHGWLVVRTGLPSFLVTLASLFILRGVAIGVTRIMTGVTVVGGLDKVAAGDPVAALFKSSLFTIGGGDFKISILWWLVLSAIATWILLRAKFGNWIYGVGGSAVAARNIGVPVARVKIILFMATAASAALFACIQVLTAGSADVLRGEGKEFEAIITAVIGGTLLSGGYGSALGAVFGAFTLGVTKLGIIFAGINTDWYFAVLGVMLLVAVLVNDYTRRRASEARR